MNIPFLSNKIRQVDDDGMLAEAGSLTLSNIWNAPSYVESRHFKPDIDMMESSRCLCLLMDIGIANDYTHLRTQILQRTSEKGWNTIMITSAGPDTGKTLTAINLSLTLAKTCNDKVLLVDCDLNEQAIYRYMGLPGDKGLVDILLNGCSMNQVMVWPGIEKMTVISGGRPIQSSSELLGSPQMAALVSEMKTRYPDRYVFFDMPAVLHKADAMAFAPLVDCILVVVEDGKTTNKDIKNTVEKLPKEKILGYVYNKKK